MPRKLALQGMSPTAQRIHDAQFQALIEAQAAEPNPPLDLAKDTLRSRRVALGLTTSTVASHLQIAESSLRNYESGTHEPGLKAAIWRQMLALYRVDTDELFALIENTQAESAAAREPAAK